MASSTALVARAEPQDARPPLLVAHPQLAHVLTVLGDVTAACKIVHPSHLARDNILQQLQAAWSVALHCATACDALTIVAESQNAPSCHPDDGCREDSASGTTSSCTGRSPVATSPTTADAGRGDDHGGDSSVPRHHQRSVSAALSSHVDPPRRHPPRRANSRFRNIGRSNDQSDDDSVGGAADDDDEPLLAKTITGMLRTVNLAAATCYGGTTSRRHPTPCAASVVTPSATSTMPNHNDDGDHPILLCPQPLPLLTPASHESYAAVRFFLELFSTVQSIRQRVVADVLAQYYSISLLSSTDHVLNEVEVWVQQLRGLLSIQCHSAAQELFAAAYTSNLQKKQAIPFAVWMQLVVEAQPTVAATRLLGRCRHICIEGSLDAMEALGAEGTPFVAPVMTSPHLMNTPSTPTPLSASSHNSSTHNAAAAWEESTHRVAEPQTFRCIVVAVRTVAPCHHAQECLGNRQLLFVHWSAPPLHSNGVSKVNEDEDEEGFQDLSSTSTIHTVLAVECSVGTRNRYSDDGGADDDDAFVMPGRLIEDKLSLSDRGHVERHWVAAGGGGGGSISGMNVHAAPSSSPVAPSVSGSQALSLLGAVHAEEGTRNEQQPPMPLQQGEEHLDQVMYRDHFADLVTAPYRSTQLDDPTEHQQIGPPLLALTAGAVDEEVAKTPPSAACSLPFRGGPRAGDAIFMAELNARLEFWTRRGATPRDFQDDFVTLARELNATEEEGLNDVPPSTQQHNATTVDEDSPSCVESTVHVSLGCFTADLGSLRLELRSDLDHYGVDDGAISLQRNTRSGALRELRKRHVAASRSLSGCTLTVVDAGSSQHPDTPAASGGSAISHLPFGVNMTAMFPASTATVDDASTYLASGRAAVEMRKLRHKLSQQTRWRGILWDPRTGKAKATLVLSRCTSESQGNRDHDHHHRFTVAWLPYIAPMMWYVEKHCALLVDLDRTVVDNAILPTAAMEQQLVSANVTWLVPTTVTTSASYDEMARGGGGGLTILRPKTEHIFLRPGVCELLRAFAYHWRCTVVLATKSTHARAEAILASLVDPDGSVFGRHLNVVRNPQSAEGDEDSSPTPTPSVIRYRVYAAEDILRNAAPHVVDDECAAIGATCAYSRRYADLLLRARKSAAAILVASSPCSIALQGLIRYAVLDDTPLVWEEADWSRVVPVTPFTLAHVDPAHYWSATDGEVVLQLIQRIAICPRSSLAPLPGHSEDDDNCWWSQYLTTQSTNDEANDGNGDEDGACSPTGAAVASAAAAVVDESDDEDDSGVPSYNNGGSTGSSWKNSSDVEDVVPL